MIPLWMVGLMGYAVGKGSGAIGGMGLATANGKPITPPGVPMPQAAHVAGMIVNPFAAWDRVCPVDPSMPIAVDPTLGASPRQCVYNAWSSASVAELETLAGQIAGDFPIAANSLFARAHQKARAEERAAALANVTPIATAAPKKGTNGTAPIVKEEKSEVVKADEAR